MLFPAFIPSFSKREREILQLIYEGYTSQEIASKLFISQQTVESHRKNMISKAGTKNMFGVIRVAIERELIAINFPAKRVYQD